MNGGGEIELVEIVLLVIAFWFSHVMLGDEFELFEELYSAHQLQLPGFVADAVFEPIVDYHDVLAVLTVEVDLVGDAAGQSEVHGRGQLGDCILGDVGIAPD